MLDNKLWSKSVSKELRRVRKQFLRYANKGGLRPKSRKIWNTIHGDFRTYSFSWNIKGKENQPFAE